MVTDGAGHAKTSCDEDPTECAAGQKYKPDLEAKSQGSCAACQSGRYQEVKDHKNVACKPQSTCDKGKFLDGATAKTDGSCQACATGTFQGQDNVRTACKPQSTCKAGQFLQGNTATSAGSCAACTDNTYQDETGHSKAACKGNTVTTCDKGAALDKPKEPTRATKCTTCAAGHYQQNDDSTDQCTQQVRAADDTRHDRVPAHELHAQTCPLVFVATQSYTHASAPWLSYEQPTQCLRCMHTIGELARQAASATPLTMMCPVCAAVRMTDAHGHAHAGLLQNRRAPQRTKPDERSSRPTSL